MRERNGEGHRGRDSLTFSSSRETIRVLSRLLKTEEMRQRAEEDSLTIFNQSHRQKHRHGNTTHAERNQREEEGVGE
jgi:arginyl-tRNA--protein-N-Asp/Glu arginylyltransferase